MICEVCYNVLRGHQGAQWRGTYDLHFDHHTDLRELEKSADMKCVICRSMQEEMQRTGNQSHARSSSQRQSRWTWNQLYRALFTLWSANSPQDQPESLPESEAADISEDMRALAEKERWLVTAYLSEVNDHLYRLDFKLKDNQNVGTFILKETTDDDYGQFNTPFSTNTSSDEVLQLAKAWISDCRYKHDMCPGESSESKWYPTRLIDLGHPDQNGRWPDDVRLVITAHEHTKDFYVTLSHCWGGVDFLKLTDDNLGDFMKGMPVVELPRTFQDAIQFSRRLGDGPSGFDERTTNHRHRPTVRYIWIDSLCIKQSDRNDWLRESDTMNKVYENSYCNISATAAKNSNSGLFCGREPRELWEDEINLNIEGIPITQGSQSQASIRRCLVQDLSFWARNIDDAPVNRRGWVLQERLLAPRVIHFCANQIAWECCELRAAESARSGTPGYRVREGILVTEPSVKSLLPHPGREESLEPVGLDEEANSDLKDAAYEGWRHIVGVYSKTNLTKPEDKLIALSGIAQLTFRDIQSAYLAGIWEYRMAEQLLWRVDPVFAEKKFHYKSTRPKAYRAPSWSWAAVDTPQGITWTNIRQQDLKFKVEEPSVVRETKNSFGLVKRGHVYLKGLMKKIEMEKSEKNGSVRYSWQLQSMIHQPVARHDVVYLDSPLNDTGIFGHSGNMFCMFAGRDTDGYFVFLLLQLELSRLGEVVRETKNYKRVGLAKISPYEKKPKQLLELSGDESSVPYGNWNASTRKHRVQVV